MRLNTNVVSLNVFNNMRKSNDALSNSMSKLSSGLKINNAKDDAAGFAISKKLDSQVRAMKRGSDNAVDGTSLLQTADGALGEMQSMVQRMRELSVQAANGTNTDEDRMTIQDEISSLSDEIEDMANRTEFNGIDLLNGGASRAAGEESDKGTVDYISDSVNNGVLEYEITTSAKQAEVSTSYTGSGISPTSGSISINGVNVEIDINDTDSDINAKLEDALDQAGMTIDSGTIKSDAYGSDATISISGDPALLTDLGIPDTTTNGTDAVIDINNTNMYTEDGSSDNIFNGSKYYTADGNKVTISSTQGQEIIIDLTPGEIGSGYSEITDMGQVNIQVSSNKDSVVSFYIDSVDLNSLGIEDLDVQTQATAEEAITKLDDALAKISEVRSQIGAYSNRLDFTVTSVDIATETTETSLSRIQDTDMAEEMTEYTKNSVIYQAATAIMAQSNERPQQILQLLQ